jgi:hypothetical protein|tara:strand:+ start:454 stop:753 length:300 start_codon:yes stop_codon:yes gene_type:complete
MGITDWVWLGRFYFFSGEAPVALKISNKQRSALFLASNCGAYDSSLAGRGGTHIGKRTWEALRKKGLVTKRHHKDSRWHLTPLGWRVLQQENAARRAMG